MSFTWKQKKAALRSVFAGVLKLDRVNSAVLLADGTFEGADSEAIQWENERGASRPTRGIWCDLRLSQIIPIGQDEIRYDYDIATDRLLPTYGGPRRFSVMVILGADDQSDYEAVGDVAGRLRTRLMREEFIDELVDTDLGLTRIGQTLNVDYEDDGVMYSQSMTEVFFETNEQDEPEADELGSYIGEVEIEGELLSGFDGDPIDVSVTVTAAPVIDITSYAVSLFGDFATSLTGDYATHG
jgi:hypothetical protein